MQYARDARMAVTQGLKRGLTAEEAAWLETREG
jgi:hypothetical protein